jgi:hypothetical protein
MSGQRERQTSQPVPPSSPAKNPMPRWLWLITAPGALALAYGVWSLAFDHKWKKLDEPAYSNLAQEIEAENATVNNIEYDTRQNHLLLHVFLKNGSATESTVANRISEYCRPVFTANGARPGKIGVMVDSFAVQFSSPDSVINVKFRGPPNY